MSFQLLVGIYEKFWKFPLLFAETKEEAIETAEKLLSQVAVGSPSETK